MHAFLGDHALGLALADVRLALVVGDYEADLCAAQVGQAASLCQRHVEVGRIVDDLDSGLERRHGVDAHLGDRSAQRIDDADDHFVLGSGRPAEGQGGKRGRDGDRKELRNFHRLPPVDVSMRASADARAAFGSARTVGRRYATDYHAVERGTALDPAPTLKYTGISAGARARSSGAGGASR